jgi:hypothetical protein
MSAEQIQEGPHYEVTVAWRGMVFSPALISPAYDLARDAFDGLLDAVRRCGGTLELRLHDGAGNTTVHERYTREVGSP